MKALTIALLLTMATAHTLFAQLSQDDANRERQLQEKAAKLAADTTKKEGWYHSMLAGVNLTQVSFKDWAQGGESA